MFGFGSLHCCLQLQQPHFMCHILNASMHFLFGNANWGQQQPKLQEITAKPFKCCAVGNIGGWIMLKRAGSEDEINYLLLICKLLVSYMRRIFDIPKENYEFTSLELVPKTYLVGYLILRDLQRILISTNAFPVSHYEFELVPKRNLFIFKLGKLKRNSYKYYELVLLVPKRNWGSKLRWLVGLSDSLLYILVTNIEKCKTHIFK